MCKLEWTNWKLKQKNWQVVASAGKMREKTGDQCKRGDSGKPAAVVKRGKQITGAKRGKTPPCEVVIGFDFAPNWLMLDKAASFRSDWFRRVLLGINTWDKIGWYCPLFLMEVNVLSNKMRTIWKANELPNMKTNPKN